MIEPAMRRTKRPLLFISGLIIVSLAISMWQLIAHQFLPIDPADASLLEVRIPSDSSASQVAAILKTSGLIRNERVFLYYCREAGLDKQLKAGLYDFSRSQSLQEIAQQISAGQVKTASFTVPEGYTVKQIGDLLIKKEICTQTEWDQALKENYSYNFIGRYTGGDPNNRLEGFLFPETYNINEDTSAQEIIAMMLERFDMVWKNNFAEQAQLKNLKLKDAIIIASLVEREARVPEERKRIAGVVYNRLKLDMPLQIDATVLYSLGEHRDMVTYKDLEVDSPYNTYRYTGLPAGPISCPGRASIEAALAPEVNNYLYYVARGDNTHYFSTTYSEHLEAKHKYGL